MIKNSIIDLNTMTFSSEDKRQMAAHGITPEQVAEQLSFFHNGFPFLQVVSPALAGKGVHHFDVKEQDELIHLYEKWGGSRIKFVPASGAATRMFKELYEAQDLLEHNPQAPLYGDAARFFDTIHEFAFYPLLASDSRCNLSDRRSILQLLLSKDGLSYGSLPKGLIPFHRYNGIPRSAFEEHLVEAALYSTDCCGVAKVHFTVSPEHQYLFELLTSKVVPLYEKRFGVKYQISFSEQKAYTDTIAVDLQNQPFRQKDGRLLFRPGGHGALLENLNELQEELVFIKNVDNVVIEELLPETVRWKKVLAGKLISIRSFISNALKELEHNDSSIFLKEILRFLEKNFSIVLPQMELKELVVAIKALLNRPLRVCGVVQNSGEPGGGPFVVKDANGVTSLQILETAQIDTKTAEGVALLSASTYFNPVDIVCSFKDYRDGAFSLPVFSDRATGFISEKSKDGDKIKVLELPGLWNGAMSHWNTLFVEVPSITFNPVKSVIDLLRPEHCKFFT